VAYVLTGCLSWGGRHIVLLSAKRYNKKSRQAIVYSSLDSLGMNAAVELRSIHLLTFLLPPPLFMGGRIFHFMKIFLLIIVARAPNEEKSLTKLNNTF
jgi:hypothetical protein